MTTFQRLRTMDDLQIQDWLRKIGRLNAESLAIALVGADDEVRSRVYRNMSGRARSLLAADVERNQKQNIKPEVINSNSVKLEKLI